MILNDSKIKKNGDLFVCIKRFNDIHKFHSFFFLNILLDGYQEGV